MKPAEAVEDYLYHISVIEHKAVATIASYKNDLSTYQQFLQASGIEDISQVDSQLIQQALGQASDSLQRRSVAHYLTSIRNLHAYLFITYNIADPAANISIKVNSDHLPSFLNEEQISQLFAVYDPAIPEECFKLCLLEVIYTSGMRVSEVCNLQAGHVNLTHLQLRIIGKGSKERQVLINQPTGQLLSDYFTKIRPGWLYGKNSNLFFITSKAKPVSRQYIFSLVKQTCQKAGLNPSHVSPHTLRHSFATHMLASDADLRSVQELLGHSNIATTQIYTHVQTKQLHQAYDKLPRAAKKELEEK